MLSIESGLQADPAGGRSGRRWSRLPRGGLSAVLLASWLLAASAPAQDAGDLPSGAGVAGGLVVHVQCGRGEATMKLRAGPQYVVHGLDTDAANVAAARRHILEAGAYGPVCADAWDGEHLPYADNLVNLIVIERLDRLAGPEVMRVLAPRGVAMVRGKKLSARSESLAGGWTKTVKPWPKEMDEWTHYLHGPDGNPTADDLLVGPPRRLRWVGSPRWARHHDHMASMTSMVSAGGRVFYIFDEGPTASIQLPSRWRLIARDAFNGTVLWKREIDQWNTRQYPLKSGPAHLLRRLVAVGERVYVTLGIDAPAVALDAATGRTVREYEGSEHTREIVADGGVVFLVADEGASRLPDWRRRATYVWDNSRRANTDWGWPGGKRKLLAYEADSGKRLWAREVPVAPCSLAVAGERAVFHDGAKLVCLNRRTGKALWEGAAAPTKRPIHSSTGPRVLIYKGVVLLAANDGKMSGWSAESGKKLWEQRHRPSGHQSLKDLFVVRGLTWTGAIAGSGDDGTFVGYDPATGEVRKQFPADVKVHWFHHRCYPSKAAGKYLLTARNGTEFVDVEAQHWQPHHWVRGGCIYGVMPCNGLMYAPMDSCGCQLEAKLNGLVALAPGPVPQARPAALAGAARLQKGPAYGKVDGPPARPTDWPTYRHDAARSGTTDVRVATALKRSWQAKVPGRLTPPTVAAGKLFVASVDTHTLHALDARGGRGLWTFAAGGRIDSPPTYHRGLVLFGSADGYVYAVGAADGALAWRFRGAPMDRRMMAWEQVESAWPVHGSVLVREGVVYCTAGRNMYVDGGLRFLKLDAATGELLAEVVMDDKDPASGEDMHLAYLKRTRGNNMPVAHSDILSCDGRNLWMRSQKIDFAGQRHEIALKGTDEQPPADCHLFCQNGFLDDSYFFRSYWTFGRRVGGGYGAWYQAGRLVPAGRILCFDDERVYGFGRKPSYMVNASVLEYQLFASDKTVTREAIAHIRKAEQAMNMRSRRRNASSSDWLLRHFYGAKDLTAARFAWTLEEPAVIVRAMAVAGPALFVAGPEDLIDERQAFHLPDDADVQAALRKQTETLEGRHGGLLWAMTKADGKCAARYRLDTLPVFDGMAVADERLYVATIDGRVLCLAGDGAAALPPADDGPLRVAWEKPEDPNYLLPPPVLKEGDFAKVTRCNVLQAKLGYRLRAKGSRAVGLALKKLPKPIRGAVTFRTRVQCPTGHGMSRNGYLAFGSGPADARLVKCGVRFRGPRAAIIQGPLRTGKTTGARLKAAGAKGVELVVTVDTQAGTVSLAANGVTVQAKLLQPMKAVTHVGYAVDSALADFAPIEIKGP